VEGEAAGSQPALVASRRKRVDFTPFSIIDLH
jgi:hypothetical protein